MPRAARVLRVVDSSDQADFVFFVCSRYLHDVYDFSQAPPPFRDLPNRRLSAQALALTVSIYKRSADSYRDLLGGSLWKADAREFALPERNWHIVETDGPGKEDHRVMVRSGPARPAPGDASIKEIVDALISQTK
jgi:hypothetical protein